MRMEESGGAWEDWRMAWHCMAWHGMAVWRCLAGDVAAEESSVSWTRRGDVFCAAERAKMHDPVGFPCDAPGGQDVGVKG